MNRLPGTFLLLLALWVQILAPVATLWAVTGVAGDPLAGLTLCGHSLSDAVGDASDEDRQPASPLLCGLCCAAIAVLDTPPPDASSVALAWAVLVFMAPPGGPIRTVTQALTRVRDPPIPV